MGQYRRQRRVRNIRGQREAALNKQGGKEMKFNENTNISPSRASHTKQIVEVFGFGKIAPKGMEVPDQIGRALGQVGYHTRITPDPQGKVSIVGIKKNMATGALSQISLYVMPWQETVIITKWAGADEENLHKGLTHLVRATPSHYLLLPDYQLPGQDLLKQVMRENPRHRWAGRSTAHNLMSAHVQHKGLGAYTDYSGSPFQRPQQFTNIPRHDPGVISPEEYDRIQQAKTDAARLAQEQADREEMLRQEQIAQELQKRSKFRPTTELIPTARPITASVAHVDPAQHAYMRAQQNQDPRRLQQQYQSSGYVAGQVSSPFRAQQEVPVSLKDVVSSPTSSKYQEPQQMNLYNTSSQPDISQTRAASLLHNLPSGEPEESVDNSHRHTRGQPWGIHHPAAQKIAAALESLRIGVTLKETVTKDTTGSPRKTVLIQSQDGETVIRMTLSGGRGAKGHQRGEIHFESVSMQYLPQFIKYALPGMALKSVEPGHKPSKEYPILWMFEFGNLTKYVHLRDPDSLGSLEAVYKTFPKNRTHTGMIARHKKNKVEQRRQVPSKLSRAKKVLYPERGTAGPKYPY